PGSDPPRVCCARATWVQSRWRRLAAQATFAPLGKVGRPVRQRRGRWPWLRPIGWTVLAAGFAVGFAAAAFMASLDRQVRERFEGTQFRVPSRVYSAPAILYPGLDWRRFGLEAALSRLG